MSLVSSLIRRTTYPLYLRHRGLDGFLAKMDMMARLEKFSAVDLAELQLESLQNLMKHVYRNSPYYRQVFRDIGMTPSDIESIEDLRHFPVLTKDIIRDNMDQILAENYPPHTRAKSSTGGSTGQSLTFWRDHNCRDMKTAMEYNFKRWYGFELGDKQLYFWGAVQDFDQHESFKTRLVRSLATRSWFVTSSDLDDDNLERTVQWIRKLKPKLVQAYPSIIYSFAKRIASKNIRLNFDTIVCSAEQLFDYQREALEVIFGARVYNKYGSREFGSIAAECPKYKKMHYFAPGVIMESVDSQGRPAGDKLGNLLVTDLWHYAMPLIRYQVGDLVRLEYSHCPCGSKLPKIAEVAGRVVDVVTKPNGKMITGLSLIKIIRKLEYKIQAQLIQKSPNYFEFNYVAEKPLSEQKMNIILNRFESVMESPVEIEFIQHDRLEREKSGKFRYVKSEVKPPFLS